MSLRSDLDQHCAQLVACRRCVLAPGVVPIASAARAPRAMLVGQAPGQTEMHGGRPFAGRAGKTLFQWLQQAGLSEADARKSLYIAAITRCYPGPHRSGRGDRVPTPAEQHRCADWLAEELRIIRPRVVIPVGRLAIDRFLGKIPLDQAVGREHEIDIAGRVAGIIPLPHPSGASSWIYGAGHRALLDRSLELIGERLSGNQTPKRSVA